MRGAFCASVPLSLTSRKMRPSAKSTFTAMVPRSWFTNACFVALVTSSFTARPSATKRSASSSMSALSLTIPSVIAVRRSEHKPSRYGRTGSAAPSSTCDKLFIKGAILHRIRNSISSRACCVSAPWADPHEARKNHQAVLDAVSDSCEACCSLKLSASRSLSALRRSKPSRTVSTISRSANSAKCPRATAGACH